MKKTLFILCVSFTLLAQIATAETLCVKVSKANLRTGPGTDYVKSWEVVKYMPFEKVGISLSGEWYAVRDVDGDVHWISKQLVDETCRSAVVTGDNIAIRSGPGKTHARTRLGRVSKYHCFQILKQQGDWIQVRDVLNAEGWIHKKNLWAP